MMAYSINASDVVALFALIIAGWSALQTGRFNRRQNEFSETAERLNQLLIAREASETELQRKAEVFANVVKIGKYYSLKVFNRGLGPASNVRLEFIAGADLVPQNELNEKFPFPLLERQQGTELPVYVTMGSERRLHIRLLWDDDGGADQTKELWLDVF